MGAFPNGGIKMIVLSNTTAQTLEPGQAITFNNKILHTGCAECHRANTGSVKMRSNGTYVVQFSGNIGGATAATAVQLSIQIGGATLPETTMISVPATANDLNNVATVTAIRNTCGDYDRLTVVNTGTNPVIVGANTAFVIRRVA